MPLPTPPYLQKQQEKNPIKIDLKVKLLQFFVTRLGLVVGGITSATVTATLAFMASRLGVDFTQNPEMTGAMLLFVNQAIWGGIQWAVKTYEFPFKQELQEILGGNIMVDGLIGSQTVERAKTVKEFALSSAPLPTSMR